VKLILYPWFFFESRPSPPNVVHFRGELSMFAVSEEVLWVEESFRIAEVFHSFHNIVRVSS